MILNAASDGAPENLSGCHPTADSSINNDALKDAHPMDQPIEPASPAPEVENQPLGTEHTGDLYMMAAVFWGLMVLLVVTQYLRS